MTPRRIALISVAALAAALPTAASAKDSTGLRGEVGPGFTIQMKNGSAKLRTLKAGTYSIKIEDKSSMHNFRLQGPGLNKSTSVSGTTETTWRVKLKPGTYRFQCDPHASSMKGSFRVTG